MPKRNWIHHLFLPRNNYAFLLSALLTYMFVYPFFDLWLPRLANLVDIFLIFIFVSACYSTIKNKSIFYLSIVLLILGIGILGISSLADSLPLKLAGAFFSIAFCTLITGSIIREVFSAHRVNLNIISGALCGYLFMALMWGLIYLVIEMAVPGSFIFPDLEHAVNSPMIQSKSWPAFQYFSFVTITTLGYGDVTPISRAATSMAFLEAVLGQFYLVVLVAKLVGQYAVRPKSGPSRED